MGVVQGNRMLASEFNTIKTEVNRWYADNYAGSISFGNANQTFGWGGSPAGTPNTGDLIRTSSMNTLVDRCNIGEDICNNVSGQLSQIVKGNKATAANLNTIESKSDLIYTNRLDIEAAEMSLAWAGGSSKTVSIPLGWNQVNCLFRFNFSSFDKTRYFFNSGGALAIDGSQSGYSTGTGKDGAGFDEIFSTMGTVYMDHTQVIQSGSGGTVFGKGYYDLSTIFTTIFRQSGTGAYSDAELVLSARYGVGAGSWIEIGTTLTAEAGRTVDGTTAVISYTRKLNGQSSGLAGLTITAPTFFLIDPL